MIHSCSYYCDRPECIRSQRDYLRDLAEQNAAPQPVRSIAVEETQAGVGKAAAVAAPTPRTDKACHNSPLHQYCELADFARQLERELAAAVKRIADKHKTNLRWIERVDQAETALAEAQAEIARLRNIARHAINVAHGLTNYVEHRPGLKQAMRELDELTAAIDAARGKP